MSHGSTKPMLDPTTPPFQAQMSLPIWARVLNSLGFTKLTLITVNALSGMAGFLSPQSIIFFTNLKISELPFLYMLGSTTLSIFAISSVGRYFPPQYSFFLALFTGLICGGATVKLSNTPYLLSNNTEIQS